MNEYTFITLETIAISGAAISGLVFLGYQAYLRGKHLRKKEKEAEEIFKRSSPKDITDLIKVGEIAQENPEGFNSVAGKYKTP